MPRSTSGDTVAQGRRRRARLRALHLCAANGCGAPTREPAHESEPPPLLTHAYCATCRASRARAAQQRRAARKKSDATPDDSSCTA